MASKLKLPLLIILSLFQFSYLLPDQLSLDDVMEEDWGGGLKVLSIYKPKSCENQAKRDDVVHYHYVGRLASDGSVFGKSFDYNSPYIVSLGQGKIIPGMDQGLMGICLWERRRISFPPNLGYGSRGVGNTIPPNASLVFYVRLIKLERNGHVLGEDADISSIWHSGLVSYSSQKWQQTVDMMNEALRLYYQYENQTLVCIKRCESEDFYLSDKTKLFLKEYLEFDPSVERLVQYSANGTCLRNCKTDNLPPNLHNPDPVLMEMLRRREPYSYLHYAYYQIGELEEAAKCCFTFLHYNPTDELALSSIGYYRNVLNMTENDFIYKESYLVLYQEPYIKGKREYQQENWLEAVDLFEDSVKMFVNTHSDCNFLCKDVTNINLTETDMNENKKELLQEYDFMPDSMEYNELLLNAIKELLKCRNTCFERASIIEGRLVDDYFISHFNYLQYGYFKLGNVLLAAESAATYLAMDPSSDSMAHNFHYYLTTYKLESQDIIPRNAIVQFYQNHETNKRLLYFIEHGQVIKREGKKGDTGEQVSSREEL